eukprot:CAMPEP_0184337268 /NCGR_PEP_ID=MMETSP1089-20130417/5647_1 /TAXON_ID=38269 ORGANISM="Gloeochaete wittrockiana, Strain SAG46.84" /NCGR_SAMPLE_ID=MMETSP1089 /ASSEMBLY_ACC=CAM_ASM_000445 /LENGTH=190 /DNA_ID=CAMNT_0026662863 /DNA_START=19 /DNA_END=588 /DNA_ORIENTATION=-
MSEAIDPRRRGARGRKADSEDSNDEISNPSDEEFQSADEASHVSGEVQAEGQQHGQMHADSVGSEHLGKTRGRGRGRGSSGRGRDARRSEVPAGATQENADPESTEEPPAEDAEKKAKALPPEFERARVPTKGQFFMHDDRDGGTPGAARGRGAARGGRDRKLWEAPDRTWAHDKFEELQVEETVPHDDH